MSTTTTTLIHKASADPPPEKSEGPVIDPLKVPHITLHAYCDTPEMIETMERAVADRRMSRAHAPMHRGGIAAAVDSYRKAASPNLLVLESRASVADLHAELEDLADV